MFEKLFSVLTLADWLQCQLNKSKGLSQRKVREVPSESASVLNNMVHQKNAYFIVVNNPLSHNDV